MIDREELERLHEAATPAPWTAHPVRGYAFDEVFHRTGAGELLCVCADHQIDYRDAPLIAHLRNAVPDILNLLTERDTLAAECIKWAREAGEAKGKLEGSEAAGVVDQWREKCEQLEAENAALTAAIPAIRAQAVAEIVAWLRDAAGSHGQSDFVIHCRQLADAIERGSCNNG